jgi:hypothetical protein
VAGSVLDQVRTVVMSLVQLAEADVPPDLAHAAAPQHVEVAGSVAAGFAVGALTTWLARVSSGGGAMPMPVGMPTTAALSRASVGSSAIQERVGQIDEADRASLWPQFTLPSSTALISPHTAQSYADRPPHRASSATGTLAGLHRPGDLDPRGNLPAQCLDANVGLPPSVV